MFFLDSCFKGFSSTKEYNEMHSRQKKFGGEWSPAAFIACRVVVGEWSNLHEHSDRNMARTDAL